MTLAGARVDVRITGTTVTEIGAIPRVAGEMVVSGKGCTLLPGLTDHHLHLFAWAAAESSVLCGPPTVRSSDELRTALASAPADGAGWVRGVGYAESIAGDLDAPALDALHSERPVRVQHRSGALWILNSKAVTCLGLTDIRDPGIERDEHGGPTGRLWRADHLFRGGPDFPDLGPVSRRLSKWGITSVTDATPDLEDVAVASLQEQIARGRLTQRVLLLGHPGPFEGPLTSGARKVVLGDHALPGLAALVGILTEIHAAGRPVAVHCVTRESLILLLSAFDVAGSIDGDRIEHGAVIPAECLEWISAHGLRVVTQPGFLSARGEDFLRRTRADEHADLYRYRSLLRAGVTTVASSDAPYGPADPWRIIANCRDRLTDAGRTVSRSEAVDAGTALRGYLTPAALPRRHRGDVRVGMLADLVLLEGTLGSVLAEPDAERVRMTMSLGKIVYSASGMN
ncbi:amidohydrolase family protein [Actinomadura rudentiformis]|uniref:amidohydrolase family protein n=1 Tax=Actinomadura rudentiformis TaxID=359158 RepID=UPI001CEF7E1E|nr:amidohydrolase family protein [Actinomadura rudentiformis]